MQRAADQARRDRRRKRSRLAIAVLLPLTSTAVAWSIAESRKAEDIAEILSPETVARKDSVQEQFLHAAERNDEMGWKSVSEYFPAGDNATNAAYHAKAALQLASFFEDEGDLRRAEQTLEHLLHDQTVDRVYQVLALARRCMLLDQLDESRKMAESKRELQSLYDELKRNNPGAGRLIDRLLAPGERSMLGIGDS